MFERIQCNRIFKKSVIFSAKNMLAKSHDVSWWFGVGRDACAGAAGAAAELPPTSQQRRHARDVREVFAIFSKFS